MFLSYCALKSGDDQRAIEYTLKAIELRPDIPDLYYNLSFAYNRIGNSAKAIEYKKKGDEVKAKK